jgi:hypothetical protein
VVGDATITTGPTINAVVAPTLRTFLQMLYPVNEGYLDLRALPSRAQAFIPIGDKAGVATFLSTHAEEHVYIGVATRRSAESGALENCAELSCVFVDIDFKTTSEADARERLATFPLSPSLVINSGGGLHVYWLMREPFRLPEEADAAQSLLRRVAQHFGGDLASAEPARVLRVPTSFNVKYDPPRLVTIEHIESTTYNASEFDEWLPAEIRPNRSAGQPFTAPERICDGTRNDTLYRTGRSLHAKGFSGAAITAALLAENGEKCDPPLGDDEVRRIAHNAATQRDHDDFDPTPGARATIGGKPPTETPQSFAETAPIFLARLDQQKRPPDLVTGLLPGCGSAMFHGQPRVMKTLALLDLSIACATGTTAFSMAELAAPEAVAVWYLSEEDPQIEVRDRLRALLAGRSIEVPERLHLSVQQSIDLDDPTWQQAVIAYAIAHAVRLTIIDPVRASTAAADQGPRELQPFASFLRQFTRETGSVLFLGHHDTKPPRQGEDTRSRPQRASGGGIFSIIDCPIHIERVDNEEKTATKSLITPTGYKFGAAPAPLLVTLQTDAPTQPTWIRLVGETTNATDAVRVALHDRILAYLRAHSGTSGTKLASGLHRSKNDVFAALEALRRAGAVDYYARGQAHLWFVPGWAVKP